ncbi:hypothetical protein [Coralloluteibacterium stylophorae]|uniref:Uncharacterized protein n=3 Tax=Coralloluteibacterium stylophorae TaxID=1776034 RepID=A0AAP2CCR0_9GAMM|nr:hypothetical protein [Coralloluteibacterium stylophorae]MBS7458030.1 hypothetical protein [Coralloluteibacterium stylophorae]
MPLLDKLLGGKGLPDPLGLFGRGGGRGGAEMPLPGGLSRQFGGPQALGGSHLADALTRAGYTTPAAPGPTDTPTSVATGPGTAPSAGAPSLLAPPTPGLALARHLGGGIPVAAGVAPPHTAATHPGSPAVATATVPPGPALPLPGPTPGPVAGALQSLGQAVHGLLGGRGASASPVLVPGAPGATLPAATGQAQQSVATPGASAIPGNGATGNAPGFAPPASPIAAGPSPVATAAAPGATLPGPLAGAARSIGDAVGSLLGLTRADRTATQPAATPLASAVGTPAGAPTASQAAVPQQAQVAASPAQTAAAPPAADPAAPGRQPVAGAHPPTPPTTAATMAAPQTTAAQPQATAAAAQAEQAPPVQIPRPEVPAQAVRSAGEVPAPPHDAAAQPSASAAGNTATSAALAAPAAAGATVLASGAPAAGDRAADARLAQGTTADLRAPVREPPPGVAYTADGPMRRSLRQRLRTVPGAMTRLLVTLGLAGPQILVRDADPERERQRALQQVFWVLALVAYGCLALSLLMLLPALREGGLAPAAATGGGASLLVGLAAAVAAWWVTHRLTRRRGTNRRR